VGQNVRAIKKKKTFYEMRFGQIFAEIFVFANIFAKIYVFEKMFTSTKTFAKKKKTNWANA
jgi:hypothetical protein